ncbi:cupin domain-containing protein [Pseudomarimonas arenosa]|uniref:Cupin domain-containing protein n=1 Tax=Pseudomarimonas arenosa TaxID=2774145 RepID=A0AAW3ZUL5_9GAMM|nr:cupin domain-containing protein [Pseudomarimonas arenosa]MBD8527781.1 cupin domain-containing protein [Pseudomarimonas arenosa]
MDIGARLQKVRLARGLSQRELAKRANVTNSTISLIEQNKVSPSISSLKKVLDGIPISLAEFFTFEEVQANEDGPFYRATELPDVGNNEVHYFLVGKRQPQRQMCMLRELMPPGSDTGESMYSHAGEEAGVIIRGEVEVTVGEHCRVLRAGDAYYFESRTPHRFRNVGEGEAELISANTPPTF